MKISLLTEPIHMKKIERGHSGKKERRNTMIKDTDVQNTWENLKTSAVGL